QRLRRSLGGRCLGRPQGADWRGSGALPDPGCAQPQLAHAAMSLWKGVVLTAPCNVARRIASRSSIGPARGPLVISLLRPPAWSLAGDARHARPEACGGEQSESAV